jgi:hypothetical protein
MGSLAEAFMEAMATGAILLVMESKPPQPGRGLPNGIQEMAPNHFYIGFNN